jgi:hypothetical protein
MSHSFNLFGKRGRFLNRVNALLKASVLSSDFTTSTIFVFSSIPFSFSFLVVDCSDGTLGRGQDNSPELPHRRGQDYWRGSIATARLLVQTAACYSIPTLQQYFLKP